MERIVDVYYDGYEISCPLCDGYVDVDQLSIDPKKPDYLCDDCGYTMLADEVVVGDKVSPLF